MSKSARNITKNPKVMFNQGERKFTAMDPKDDAVVDKMYNPPKQSDTPFQDILPRLQGKKKPRPKVANSADTWAIMKATANAKERRELREIERKAKAKENEKANDYLLNIKPLPIDLEIFKKFSQEESDKEYKKLMDLRKPDPDLVKGIGSLFKPKRKG